MSEFFNQDDDASFSQDPWKIGAAWRHIPLGLRDGVQEPLELDFTDEKLLRGYLGAVKTLAAWQEVQESGDEVWRSFHADPDIEKDLLGRGLDPETVLMVANCVHRDLQEITDLQITS